MEPNSIRIFFDGYCPESMLLDKRVEMRLNEDDFWESKSTGLQIAVFPPQAVLIRWRGEGKFRVSSGIASDVCTGLIMTESSLEEGKEAFPTENPFGTIGNNRDLKLYLDQIYPSNAAYDEEHTLDWSAPILKEQEEKLRAFSKNVFEELTALFDTIIPRKELSDDAAFNTLHEKVYQHKIIFNYKWTTWDSGKTDLNESKIDFSKCTLLLLSMYLTMIFRADRFSGNTISHFYNNGTLRYIFHALVPAWEREQVSV